MFLRFGKGYKRSIRKPMMAAPMLETLVAQIAKANELYHRLVLIVAPSGSGKTVALQSVAARTGVPLLNLNLEISRRMLDIAERQRGLRLPQVLEEVVGRDDPLVLLDNIGILFDVTLKQDPLRLLQGVSRNRTVAAAWSGTLENGYLSYATPEHPEHRRYPHRELVVVCPEIMPLRG